jgi:hypothetical protein
MPHRILAPSPVQFYTITPLCSFYYSELVYVCSYMQSCRLRLGTGAGDLAGQIQAGDKLALVSGLHLPGIVPQSFVRSCASSRDPDGTDIGMVGVIGEHFS